MTKQETCEQRIEKELSSTIETFKNALEGKYEDDNEYDDFSSWLWDYVLDFSDDSHFRAKRLQLSWGGPADYILFFEDGDIEYHFQDWFDGATRTLDEDDLEVMQNVYDMYLNIE